IGEIDARLRILRVVLGDRHERLDLRLVEHGGAGGSAAATGRVAGLRALRRRYERPRHRLLGSDDPARDEAEANAGDAEGNRVRFHGQKPIITDGRNTLGPYTRGGAAPSSTSRYSRTTVES